jgi:YgiT-type zinc finger domain-containing protein
MSLIPRNGKRVGRQGGDRNMATKCYFCKGRVLRERVDVDFWWRERLIVFESVPAEVCQQCGEKYFNAGIYKEMERLARCEAKPSRYISVNVIKFEEPSPVS